MNIEVSIQSKVNCFNKYGYDEFRYEMANRSNRVINQESEEAISLIPGERLLTFEIGKAFVGVSFRWIPAIRQEEIVIEALFVNKGDEGRGYGKNALRAICESAYEADVDPVLFCQPIQPSMVARVTDRGLTRSQLMAFYRSGGFRPIGTTGWLRFA